MIQPTTDPAPDEGVQGDLDRTVTVSTVCAAIAEPSWTLPTIPRARPTLSQLGADSVTAAMRWEVDALNRKMLHTVRGCGLMEIGEISFVAHDVEASFCASPVGTPAGPGCFDYDIGPDAWEACYEDAAKH